MRLSERLDDGVQTQPIGYQRILIDVDVVVIIDEIVAESLTEDSPGYADQQNADDQSRSARAISYERSRFAAHRIKPAAERVPSGRGENGVQ